MNVYMYVPFLTWIVLQWVPTVHRRRDDHVMYESLYPQISPHSDLPSHNPVVKQYNNISCLLSYFKCLTFFVKQIMI